MILFPMIIEEQHIYCLGSDLLCKYEYNISTLSIIYLTMSKMREEISYNN